MVKHNRTQTFPVLDGARSAPREDQVAGIVQRVWAEGQLYHADIERLLHQWFDAVGLIVGDGEFAILLDKARGEFARVASVTDGDDTPRCPASTLVACLYWDVQTLERTGTVEP
jgi:hypothetical protein